ncbi:WD40 repeat domain-containing protein [Planctomycetota bacterium]
MILLLLICSGVFLYAADEGVENDFDFINEGYKVKVLGDPRLRHDSHVTHSVFSPDGKYVISLAWETLRVWNANTGRNEKVLSSCNNYGIPIAISLNGCMAAMCGNNGLIRIWDINANKLIEEITGEENRFKQPTVVFSADNKKMLIGEYDGIIKLWDLERNKVIQHFKCPVGPGYNITISLDGKLAVFTDRLEMRPGTPTQLRNISIDKNIYLWDLETGKEIYKFEGHEACINAVEFSPDGKKIVSASDDGTVRLWDLESKEEIRCFKGHKGGVSAVAFAPDSKRIISGGGVGYPPGTVEKGEKRGDFSLRLWDIEKSKEIHKFTGHNHTVRSVRFSPNGKKIVSGSEDASVKIWNISTGKEVFPNRSVGRFVDTIAFAPDGQKLIVGYWSEPVEILNIHTGRKIRTLTGEWDRFVVSLDGSTVGGRGLDRDKKGIFCVKNINSGKVISSFEDPSPYSLLGLVLSHNGKRLLSSDHAGFLYLFNVETGEIINRFQMDDGWIHGQIELSPEGDKAIYPQSYKSKDIIMSNVATADTGVGEENRVFTSVSKDVSAIIFSWDGETILSGAGNSSFNPVDKSEYKNIVQLWNVETGKTIHVFEGHTRRINSVRYFPGDKIAVSGGEDRTIRLWDLETGKAIKVIHNRIFERKDTYGTAVNAIAISTDGKRFATANANGTICIYTKVK